MIPYRLYFVGFQLLYLIHTTHSFMMAANKEDIKKIAQKFVSETFAEKIADFVIKATDQMVTNLSEENDHSYNMDKNKEETDDNSHQKSSESTKYNFLRMRDRILTTKDYSREYEKSVKKYGIIEGTQKYSQKDRSKMFDKRFSIESRPEQKDRNTEDHRNQQYHPDTQTFNTKESPLQSVKKEENDQYEQQNSIESRYLITKKNKSKNKSKSHNAELSQSVETRLPYPKYKRTKQRESELSEGDSSENSDDTDSDSGEIYIEPTLKDTETPSDELAIESQLVNAFNIEITTRKQKKNEFDQYDNPRNLKPVLVATSGPVMLPQVFQNDEDKKNPYWESMVPDQSMQMQK